jgi:hypothetical protein
MPETLYSINDAAARARSAGRRRLPDDVKVRAVGLLKQHTAEEVARAVRVSTGKVVEGWKLRFGPKSSLDPDSERSVQVASPFVELPMAPLGPRMEADEEIEVELLAGGGRRLLLRGKLGASQLRALVAATLDCSGSGEAK